MNLCAVSFASWTALPYPGMLAPVSHNALAVLLSRRLLAPAATVAPCVVAAAVLERLELGLCSSLWSPPTCLEQLPSLRLLVRRQQLPAGQRCACQWVAGLGAACWESPLCLAKLHRWG